MKRTELRRRSELRRGEGPKRTPFRPKRRGRVVTASVAEAVIERAENRCERCRGVGPLHLHHKLRRSQGGSHDADNLVALCSGGDDGGCHLWVHSNPEEARQQGWLTSPNDHKNPATGRGDT